MELIEELVQHENGVIPKNWAVRKLKDIAKIRRGASPRPIDSPVWFDNKSSIGWLRISDVTKSKKYLLETGQNLSDPGVKASRFVPNGSLVMSICATVGRPILTRKNVCIHDGFVVFSDLKIDTEYLYYLLSNIENDWSKHGQTGSQMNLNTSLINSTPVPIPLNQIEQSVIASALSDTDAWIQSLTRLIEKKRQIKQGTLQQLLQPKENWLERKLGNVATLKARIGWQGLTTSEYLNSGNYYLVTGTDFKNGYIDWENCHFVDEIRYKQDKNIQLKANDVLVTKDGTIGKVALVPSLNKPATLNSGVFVIRPLNKTFDPIFFYYLLSSHYFIDFLNQLSAGSTINHLYQKDFVNFVFKTPPTLDEQVEIGRILFDMDIEISTLEKKLIKAQNIKQGMMQNLLTGRIRLI
ncbi:TPA: restriction endonuclease subunit S [Legionella pneumophila]|nr:restriction endonuclease subunit S [Legionella pneumophila]HAT8831253.1 restriction endonuclease subunit S [Legionella pneumophila subsp. pneumophila]HAU1834086.1 restriction endonuclease subunit S [Legionella pneumophila]